MEKKPVAESSSVTDVVPWERLWRRLDTEREDESFGDGFLETWRDLFGFPRQGGPQVLSELLTFRCLILCGEPGIGKTVELGRIRSAIDEKAKAGGAGFYARSFRESLSPDYLLRDLKASSEWTDWLSGRELTILIDGVDEGLALAFNLIAALTADLRGKPVARLRLILVCRDAEWPIAQGQDLLALWPEDQTARYQLQRLRFFDAEQGARAWGLDAQQTEAFMKEIGAKGLEPIAARPITLRMLVEDFKVDKKLSGNRADIYRRACIRLCREDPGRLKVTRRATGHEFTAEQLLPVASQIAGWMLLGRYTAVSALPPEQKPPQHLDQQELVSTTGDQESRVKIEAALNSGLFADAGQQGRGFAHQSYAEFLAAEYLIGFALDQILDLLCVREDGGRFVVPQLTELAAWLALRHEDFLNWIIEHEPEVLLRNDASALTDSDRSKLVGGLLQRLAVGKAVDDWSLKRFYGSLRHSSLASQVRPFLSDRTANVTVRRAAVHLSDLANLSEVFDDLLAIAKEPNEDDHLREQAINTVGRLAPENRLQDLEPFALKQVGADPHDELRAVALEALVPRLWTVSKALEAVILPRNPDFIGQFDSVCSKHLPDHIDTSDVPALLSRLTRISHPFASHRNPVSSIAEKALRVAVEHLEDLTIGNSLLSFVREKLKCNELPYGFDDVPALLNESADVRRRLCELFLRAPGASVEEIRRLLSHRLLLVKTADAPWLFENLKNSAGVERESWAFIIARHLWDFVDSPHRELLYEGCDQYPELARQIGWPCNVDLKSEDVVLRRKIALEQREREKLPKKQKPTADELFQRAIAEASADSRNWRKLAWELQRDVKTGEINAINPDPTTRDRWTIATPTDRQRIMECAVNSLLTTDGPKREPAGDPEFPLPDFWALWLARDRIRTEMPLREAVVAKRFDILCTSAFHGSAVEQDLVKLAVELDRNRACKCLKGRLEQSTTEQSNVINVLRSFEFAWTPQFTDILLSSLEKQQLTGYQLRHAVEFLAHHDAARTEAWLKDRLKNRDDSGAESLAAAALVCFPRKFWQDISSELAGTDTWASAVLQAVADIHNCSAYKPLEQFEPAHLSELFLLLEKSYPTRQPIKLSAEEKESRERLEKLRDFIPSQLEGIATAQACNELARLAQAVPHWRNRLVWRWCRARQALLRSQWSGVPLPIVREMAARSETRWVRSEDDLLVLIVDSLKRFQRELNGTEFPLIRRLWNEGPKFSPKDESALTEEIVRWLKQDLGRKNGVALGCQVEPTIVHETDIEVTARPRRNVPTQESFTVTIEVKCSFNQEVATSLEKQLAAEYLTKLGRTHGAYVVGWYRAADWKPDHNPLRAASWLEAKGKVDNLLAAARMAYPLLQLEAICLDCEFPQAFRRRPKS